MDIETGKALEERRLGPPDPSGATALAFLELSSDGREAIYTFNRTIGHLYILRGLGQRAR